MKKNTSILILAAAALALLLSVCEKPLEIQPGEFFIVAKDGLPSPGERIDIYYRSEKREEGRFSVSIAKGFGEYTKAHPSTQSVKGLFSTEYEIPDDAIGLTVYLEGLGTCFSGDLPVKVFMLYDENGVFVRGTRAWFVTNVQPEDSSEADSLERLFSDELKDNPDHLMAYANRWRNMIWRNQVKGVESEMADVLSKSEEYPEGWAALTMGYAYSRNADSSIAMFKKYMENAKIKDWAPYVVHAMDFSLIESNSDEMRRISGEIAEKYPMSYHAQSYLSTFLYDDSLSNYRNERAERIITERVKNLPKAFYELARYRLNNCKDGAAAVAAANRYEEAVVRGEIDTLEGFAGFKRAEMLEIVSRDMIAKGEIKEALDKADLAFRLGRDSDFAGRLAALCAECAFLDSDTGKAEDYIIEAIAVGIVDKAMEIIGKFQPGVDKTEYLRELFAKAESKCDSAAKITIITDNGDTVKIAESGIIVIDFWGPGCRPCIEEIPLLSELAGEYNGKPVRWLAVTNYPKSFFEEHPIKFDNWELCCSQREPFRAFLKTSAIPQFFVVDKKGLIRYSRIGSFEGKDTEAPAKILDFLLEQENIDINQY